VPEGDAEEVVVVVVVVAELDDVLLQAHKHNKEMLKRPEWMNRFMKFLCSSLKGVTQASYRVFCGAL